MWGLGRWLEVWWAPPHLRRAVSCVFWLCPHTRHRTISSCNYHLWDSYRGAVLQSLLDNCDNTVSRISYQENRGYFGNYIVFGKRHWVWFFFFNCCDGKSSYLREIILSYPIQATTLPPHVLLFDISNLIFNFNKPKERGWYDSAQWLPSLPPQSPCSRRWGSWKLQPPPKLTIFGLLLKMCLSKPTTVKLIKCCCLGWCETHNWKVKRNMRTTMIFRKKRIAVRRILTKWTRTIMTEKKKEDFERKYQPIKTYFPGKYNELYYVSDIKNIFERI